MGKLNTEWVVREVNNGWIVQPAVEPGAYVDPADVYVFTTTSNLAIFFQDRAVIRQCTAIS